MCNFSSSIRDPIMATKISIRGLKTETNKGPLMCTHNAMNVTMSPEATIP